MKLWVYLVFAITFIAIVVGLTIWMSVPFFGLHFQIDVSGVPSNNTSISGIAPSNVTVVIINGNLVFAKIGLQSIPTLINGITTSTSIIVGFTGASIGFMIRDIFPNDKKAKNAFFGVLLGFGFVFIYLFWVYVILATGGVDFALRWSLDGLLLSLLVFILTMLSAFYKLDKPKSDETEPERKEPENKEPERKETNENKTSDKNKNVNAFVNVNNQ